MEKIFKAMGHRTRVDLVREVGRGDARRENLAALIEEHFYFRNLRDHILVGGKCAACDFLDLCGGGSSSRPYIITGDPRAEDPACAYPPTDA